MVIIVYDRLFVEEGIAQYFPRSSWMSLIEEHKLPALIMCDLQNLIEHHLQPSAFSSFFIYPILYPHCTGSITILEEFVHSRIHLHLRIFIVTTLLVTLATPHFLKVKFWRLFGRMPVQETPHNKMSEQHFSDLHRDI